MFSLFERFLLEMEGNFCTMFWWRIENIYRWVIRCGTRYVTRYGTCTEILLEKYRKYPVEWFWTCNEKGTKLCYDLPVCAKFYFWRMFMKFNIFVEHGSTRVNEKPRSFITCGFIFYQAYVQIFMFWWIFVKYNIS